MGRCSVMYVINSRLRFLVPVTVNCMGTFLSDGIFFSHKFALGSTKYDWTQRLDLFSEMISSFPKQRVTQSDMAVLEIVTQPPPSVTRVNSS